METPGAWQDQREEHLRPAAPSHEISSFRRSRTSTHAPSILRTSSCSRGPGPRRDRAPVLTGRGADQKIERLQARKLASEVPASLITKMAADLQRKGSVGDRLYKQAVESQARLERARGGAGSRRRSAPPSSWAKTQRRRPSQGAWGMTCTAGAHDDGKEGQNASRLSEGDRRDGLPAAHHKHIRAASPAARAPLDRLAQMTPTQRRQLRLMKARKSIQEAESTAPVRALSQHTGDAFRLSDLRIRNSPPAPRESYPCRLPRCATRVPWR